MNALDLPARRTTIAPTRRSKERLASLGAWFEVEYDSLVRFAYFVTGDGSSAEDLVQEAFVRMHRAGRAGTEPANKAYARTTILNLARSAFRRSARSVAAREATMEPPDIGGRDEVWRAILRLSPRQRACVALRFYEDMTEREVAETLGLSLGAVKKHTDRAMTKLRDLLGRDA